MSQDKVYPMTLDGKEKLEKELDFLIGVKRQEVIEEIKIARSFGDLSENAEYDAAKSKQAEVEGRILTIENMLRNCVIIENNHDGIVGLGKTVTFVEIEDGKPVEDEETYTIVGAVDAEPSEFKISIDSPIASCLKDKKAGDIVTIVTPGGEFEVRILTVE